MLLRRCTVGSMHIHVHCQVMASRASCQLASKLLFPLTLTLKLKLIPKPVQRLLHILKTTCVGFSSILYIPAQLNSEGIRGHPIPPLSGWGRRRSNSLHAVWSGVPKVLMLLLTLCLLFRQLRVMCSI